MRCWRGEALSALEDVRAWLIAPDLPSGNPEELVERLARRLMDAGIPLWRMSTSIPTLHPEIYVRNLTWMRATGVASELRRHSVIDSPSYRGSPAELIHQGHRSLRLRAVIAEERERNHIVRALFEQGATDYWAGALRLGRQVEGAQAPLTFLSFATDAPEGFAEPHLRCFEALTPVLGLQLAYDAARYATASLLRVYLGQNAAGRVLAGGFKRGTGELIRAALWYADLRGFTELSDRRSPREVVTVLDAYFERIGGAIERAGGEILKFIGDAILAVFPVDGTAAEACAPALVAAREALGSLEELNTTRGLKLRMGIALHLGEVMYGNIGAQQRLDFTVIGAAVNEAARVEGLCKPLGVPLLLTGEFAEALGHEGLRSLGMQSLRGVQGQREVFTVA